MLEQWYAYRVKLREARVSLRSDLAKIGGLLQDRYSGLNADPLTEKPPVQVDVTEDVVYLKSVVGTEIDFSVDAEQSIIRLSKPLLISDGRKITEQKISMIRGVSDIPGGEVHIRLSETTSVSITQLLIGLDGALLTSGRK